MGVLSQLIPKPQIKELDGIEIKIVPLGVDRMEYFMKEMTNSKPEDELKKIKEIIKESIPNTTDEEIGKLDSASLVKLMSLITESNGIGKETESKIDKIKNVIEARRAQIQSNQPKPA